MSDDGPFTEEIHDHWEVEVVDPLLRVLLTAATRSLREEDQRLADAFRRAVASSRVSESNHGLGYWLFETTLVYTIFKSWLPLVETEWETRYPLECARTHNSADLVTFAKGVPRYVFEAKWWMTNRMNNELLDDIAKLRAWPNLDGRYMLTFWRSPRTPTMWSSDLDGVRNFCKMHQLEFTYVGAFDTDEAATRTTCGSYFALGVISV